MDSKLRDVIEDFGTSLDDDVERILEINQDAAACVAAVLGAYICKMVAERYGKTEKAQEILNETMQNAWEVINGHSKG